ncbi:hypothetical protein EHQ12_11335 [Leptospira gomenensis]|uniref:Uncharacterized protein n=1 Tax=Leptospira gomenensis TaxID=2484974 RepID=A0A5F1YBH2_9LEPT|nr:hypothetical protein [Leptospira gomenensis]TGK33438.1 hypothetical protein EHQ17_11135 [Leptospira gomenensis]TGK37400.1 hypothetical protein EHQ12_11335 [Leptospira gomenensis]TGK40573.1 hypothetical protein EHQ07_18380 [Leptospira gomenensis]TGK56628.1 hypothetical protein EHQ13_14945 [Leptospira gomenensis]
MTAFISFCSSVQKVYLLSYGDWEGKTIPEVASLATLGEFKSGEDCGIKHSLSRAFANALENSGYDTILDAEVTHSTGVWVPFNCVSVRGLAIQSQKIRKGANR